MLLTGLKGESTFNPFIVQLKLLFPQALMAETTNQVQMVGFTLLVLFYYLYGLSSIAYSSVSYLQDFRLRVAEAILCTIQGEIMTSSSQDYYLLVCLHLHLNFWFGWSRYYSRAQSIFRKRWKWDKWQYNRDQTCIKFYWFLWLIFIIKMDWMKKTNKGEVLLHHINY